MKIPCRNLSWLPHPVVGLLVWLLFLGTMAHAGETNSLPTTPKPGVSPARPSPQEQATQLERAGRKSEAAALYEEMARTNSVARKVLSRRLGGIYADICETNKALAWAREVMQRNPDPQAYLATVHGRLGQWREVRKILEGEIAANTNATRAVTLRWQLAETLEKQGEELKARQILNEAADAAKGTALEPAARKRLNTPKTFPK